MRREQPAGVPHEAVARGNRHGTGEASNPHYAEVSERHGNRGSHNGLSNHKTVNGRWSRAVGHGRDEKIAPLRNASVHGHSRPHGKDGRCEAHGHSRPHEKATYQSKKIPVAFDHTDGVLAHDSTECGTTISFNDQGRIERKIFHAGGGEGLVVIELVQIAGAECDLRDYLDDAGVKVRYLHSDVDTLRRIELLTELRAGVFDVLVGINLLREGLDLPEVSLVAILDADKEGFLRSATSLIQTIGRAARNVSGEVHMYASRVTRSMEQAISETERRREMQVAYNTEHNIDPTPLRKKIADITSVLAREKADSEDLLAGVTNSAGEGYSRSRGLQDGPEALQSLISTLTDQMMQASGEIFRRGLWIMPEKLVKSFPAALACEEFRRVFPSR